MTEPATPHFEISRFEVKAFLRACGLDPAEVDSVRIARTRVVATLTTEKVVFVRIKETRS